MKNQGFDPEDLEEICSRKRTKFRMKKSDFKELGRNTLLGSVDLVIGVLGAAVLTAGALNNKAGSKNKTDDLGYGYKDGNQGYGYYFGDIKDDD